MQTKYNKMHKKTNTNTSYFGSLTRISDLNTKSFAIGKVPRRTWATGDYIVGRYVTDDMEVEGKNKEDTGKECQVELSNGNLQTLHTNDLVVGALGEREATNEVVGTWQLIGSETNENHHPDNTVMNMLCGSGIFGIETSRCSKHPQSPKFIYEGHCLRFNNEKICMKDFTPSSTTTLLRDYIPNCPIILIVGSSMDSGKTYAGEQIIRMIKHDLIGTKKKTVAAAKFTGAGYTNDTRTFVDAGADFVCDFVDAGCPSTIMPPEAYRERVIPTLLRLLAEQQPDCIVAEVGASPMEAYNGIEVLKELLVSHPEAVSRVHLVICSCDAYGVMGLLDVLESEGLMKHRPDILGVGGMATANSAGVDLVKRICGDEMQPIDMKDPVSKAKFRALLKKCLMDC